MKYIARNKQNYSVQLNGEKEEQNCFAVLAENLYGLKTFDSYSGQTIEFPNKEKFKKFLLWRSIFNQCGPNNKFCFIDFARKALCEVRVVLKNDVVEIC